MHTRHDFFSLQNGRIKLYYENYSKALINFSPLKCTYLGKIHFNILSARSQKNKIEKWPLITSFQCKIVLSLSHLNAQMMTGVSVIVHFLFVCLGNRK